MELGPLPPVPGEKGASGRKAVHAPPRPRKAPNVGAYLVTSALAHLALLLGGMAVAHWLQRPKPAQQVIVTRLVRLGPQRPKEALPQLNASPKAAPDRRPTPERKPAPADVKAVPTAPAKPSPDAKAQAQARAQSRSQAESALARLKREAAGAVDGDVAGESDLAEEGDRYLAEVQRCLHAHYEILGLDSSQTQGLHALVVVRIQADGRIFDHRIAQSSGLSAFDQAVSRAVLGCGRVSPPPAHLQRDARKEGIGIDFTP